MGRGAEQSFCLLVSRPKEELTEAAARRLEALVETTDGFELAEVDLELRGEGQLLGTRQSGLSDLRFTRLRADRALLERARAAAQELIDYEARSTTRSTRCSRTRAWPRSPFRHVGRLPPARLERAVSEGHVHRTSGFSVRTDRSDMSGV